MDFDIFAVIFYGLINILIENWLNSIVNRQIWSKIGQFLSETLFNHIQWQIDFAARIQIIIKSASNFDKVRFWTIEDSIWEA